MKKTILSAALAAAAMPVYATEALLPPVVVSATRSEQSSVTTPSSITIITARQIAASGAANLAQVLDNQGGVQIKDLFGDGARATIGMRGITGGNAASNTLIMVDGRRLNNPDLAAPDLANIPLQNIERIEIIQGSAGTLFGDQAVGGVINIITRRPQKRHAHLAVVTGSYNTRGADASFSNRSGAFAYRLSTTARKSDNYREHNARDYADYSGRVDYTHTGGDIFGEFQHTEENLQLPGGLSATQAAQNPRQASPYYLTAFNDSRSDIGRLGLRQHLSGNWSLEGELSSRAESINGNNGGIFRQRRDHLGLTPRLIGSFSDPYGNALVTIGSDLDQFEYSYVSSYGNTKTHQAQQAVYAQLVAPIAPALTLTVGGRHAEAQHHITDKSAFPAGRTLTDRVNVWELGLSYKPAPQWRLYARRDGNFRFAKVDEETYTSPGVVGLAPQTGVSYEMGAEWHRGAQRAKAVIYQLDLNNEIDYDSTAPKPTYGTFNGADVNLPPTRRTGLILQTHLVPRPDLAIEGSYTYVDPRMRGGPYNGKKIPFVARNSARLSANWSVNPHWSLFGEWIYTGRRYQDSDYANTYPQLPSVAVVNVNLTYHWHDWKIGARINNLTNRNYNGYATSGYYYPAPRRNVIVTASFDT